jgi:Resolvase, N terminal domain
MLVGYARVSSVGQSLDVQLARLAHCERIFQEKRSGTTDQRPELRACLSFVREGDTLVVTKLDRLARSTLHLCTIAEQLASKGVQLDVLDQAIETRFPPPGASSFMSWGPLRSLKRLSAKSDRWKALPTPRAGACASVARMP